MVSPEATSHSRAVWSDEAVTWSRLGLELGLGLGLRLRLRLRLGLGLGLVRLDGHLVTLSGQGLVRRVQARRGDHMVGPALQVDGLPHTYPYPYPYS